MGAVTGDHSLLKIVTSANTNPPIIPPIIHGRTASGAWECASPHVQAAVPTAQTSKIPVLLTVPCTVMASPTMADGREKVRSFRAGLELLKRPGMVGLL